MNDIKVGERRRWKRRGSAVVLEEHTVTDVVDWAVRIDNGYGPLVVSRPNYDERTEHVVVPTFEVGDVVGVPSTSRVGPIYRTVVRITDTGYVVLSDLDGNHTIARTEDLKATSLKVPAIDESHWYEVLPDGSTIRNGRLVAPITINGTEHFVLIPTRRQS